MNFIDRKILERLIKGDQSAFKAIYDQMSAGVYSVAYSIVKNDDNAQEVVQDVFTKLWINKSKLDPEGNLWVFLYVVTKRLSIDRFRSEKRFKLALENNFRDDNDFAASPEDLIFYKELDNLLNLSISELPEQQRKVIELSRNKGLNHQQIASLLGLSPSTVNNHITKALTHLRLKIKNGDINPLLGMLLISYCKKNM